MPVARKNLVDTSLTRWYHCISRCVRRANLLGEGAQVGARKAWLERRLQELDAIFAVSVAGYAVMDNHLHVLVRLDPQQAGQWTADEVVERWFRLFPPRGSNRQPLASAQRKELAERLASDTRWVGQARERLSSLSWFMKCLKEPLARLVNKEEECTGAFFEGRFKSVAILDEEALLAVCAYIDLNPVAAGIAATPEESPHTSLRARVGHVRKSGRLQDLAAAADGTVAAVSVSGGLEESLWLIPIEDRRRWGDTAREGMLEGFTLGHYLLLVEHTGRMFREGKASISPQLAGVLERIGADGQRWAARMNQLRRGRWLGNFLASGRDRLRQAASRLGRHHLANFSGCPAG